MLLDFSEAIRVNVFTLGQTYVRFRPLLPYRLPLPDPSCFIGRFAAKMEFGDKKLVSGQTVTSLPLTQNVPARL
jgi:transcription factor IIIB subunit 2